MQIIYKNGKLDEVLTDYWETKKILSEINLRCRNFCEIKIRCSSLRPPAPPDPLGGVVAGYRSAGSGKAIVTQPLRV